MYSITIIVRFYKIRSLKIRIPEIIQKDGPMETLVFFKLSSPVCQYTYSQMYQNKADK